MQYVNEGGNKFWGYKVSVKVGTKEFQIGSVSLAKYGDNYMERIGDIILAYEKLQRKIAGDGPKLNVVKPDIIKWDNKQKTNETPKQTWLGRLKSLI